MYTSDKQDFNKLVSTFDRLYSLKDIKITPTEPGLYTRDLMPNGISSVPIGVINTLTVPQPYEIVKEYYQSFYENEQTPGRTERLEEIQAQKDFKNSVEILQTHVSVHEETQEEIAEEEVFSETAQPNKEVESELILQLMIFMQQTKMDI